MGFKRTRSFAALFLEEMDEDEEYEDGGLELSFVYF